MRIWNCLEGKIEYIALVMLQTAMWGVGNPLIKIAQRSMPPMWCLAFRFILASAFFVIFTYNKIKGGLNRNSIYPCLIVSLCTAGAFIACNLSLVFTTATNAGFLMSIALVFTPIFAWPILKERVDGKSIAAILVVTIGMYYLCEGALGFGAGEAMALLGSALIALSVVLTAKLIKTTGPVAIAAIQSVVSAVVCLVAAVAFEPLPKAVSGEAWLIVVYLAVGCTCFAWSIQNFVLKKLSAVLVSVLFCAEPLFTVIASRLLLDEQLTAKSTFGGALILAGLVFAAIKPQKLDSGETEIPS